MSDAPKPHRLDLGKKDNGPTIYTCPRRGNKPFVLEGENKCPYCGLPVE